MALKTYVNIHISTDGLSDEYPYWIEEQLLKRNLINGNWDWMVDTPRLDSKKNKTKDKRTGS